MFSKYTGKKYTEKKIVFALTWPKERDPSFLIGCSFDNVNVSVYNDDVGVADILCMAMHVHVGEYLQSGRELAIHSDFGGWYLALSFIQLH